MRWPRFPFNCHFFISPFSLCVFYHQPPIPSICCTFSPFFSFSFYGSFKQPPIAISVLFLLFKKTYDVDSTIGYSSCGCYSTAESFSGTVTQEILRIRLRKSFAKMASRQLRHFLRNAAVSRRSALIVRSSKTAEMRRNEDNRAICG